MACDSAVSLLLFWKDYFSKLTPQQLSQAMFYSSVEAQNLSPFHYARAGSITKRGYCDRIITKWTPTLFYSSTAETLADDQRFLDKRATDDKALKIPRPLIMAGNFLPILTTASANIFAFQQQQLSAEVISGFHNATTIDFEIIGDYKAEAISKAYKHNKNVFEYRSNTDFTLTQFFFRYGVCHTQSGVGSRVKISIIPGKSIDPTYVYDPKSKISVRHTIVSKEQPMSFFKGHEKETSVWQQRLRQMSVGSDLFREQLTSFVKKGLYGLKSDVTTLIKKYKITLAAPASDPWGPHLKDSSLTSLASNSDFYVGKMSPAAALTLLDGLDEKDLKTMLDAYDSAIELEPTRAPSAPGIWSRVSGYFSPKPEAPPLATPTGRMSTMPDRAAEAMGCGSWTVKDSLESVKHYLFYLGRHELPQLRLKNEDELTSLIAILANDPNSKLILEGFGAYGVKRRYKLGADDMKPFVDFGTTDCTNLVAAICAYQGKMCPDHSDTIPSLPGFKGIEHFDEASIRALYDVPGYVIITRSMFKKSERFSEAGHGLITVGKGFSIQTCRSSGSSRHRKGPETSDYNKCTAMLSPAGWECMTLNMSEVPSAYHTVGVPPYVYDNIVALGYEGDNVPTSRNKILKDWRTWFIGAIHVSALPDMTAVNKTRYSPLTCLRKERYSPGSTNIANALASGVVNLDRPAVITAPYAFDRPSMSTGPQSLTGISKMYELGVINPSFLFSPGTRLSEGGTERHIEEAFFHPNTADAIARAASLEPSRKQRELRNIEKLDSFLDLYTRFCRPLLAPGLVNTIGSEVLSSLSMEELLTKDVQNAINVMSSSLSGRPGDLFSATPKFPFTADGLAKMKDVSSLSSEGRDMVRSAVLYLCALDRLIGVDLMHAFGLHLDLARRKMSSSSSDRDGFFFKNSVPTSSADAVRNLTLLNPFSTPDISTIGVGQSKIKTSDDGRSQIFHMEGSQTLSSVVWRGLDELSAEAKEGTWLGSDPNAPNHYVSNRGFRESFPNLSLSMGLLILSSVREPRSLRNVSAEWLRTKNGVIELSNAYCAHISSKRRSVERNSSELFMFDGQVSDLLPLCSSFLPARKTSNACGFSVAPPPALAALNFYNEQLSAVSRNNLDRVSALIQQYSCRFSPCATGVYPVLNRSVYNQLICSGPISPDQNVSKPLVLSRIVLRYDIPRDVICIVSATNTGGFASMGGTNSGISL